jgi:hypothetical protein
MNAITGEMVGIADGLIRAAIDAIRRQGPCLICCDGTGYAAHREIDAQMARFAIGESLDALTEEFGRTASAMIGLWIALSVVRAEDAAAADDQNDVLPFRPTRNQIAKAMWATYPADAGEWYQQSADAREWMLEQADAVFALFDAHQAKVSKEMIRAALLRPPKHPWGNSKPVWLEDAVESVHAAIHRRRPEYSTPRCGVCQHLLPCRYHKDNVSRRELRAAYVRQA